MTFAKPKPYDRQPSETDKSWAAFCAYRDMGRERSLEKLKQNRAKTGGSNTYSTLTNWSSKYAWVKRCSVFDGEELERESIELQKLRLSRRLQMEKQAWERRDKLIKKADTIARMPLLKPEVSEDGTQIFMPTDKWSIKDAIAFYEYADRLGIFATGGDTLTDGKLIDELIKRGYIVVDPRKVQSSDTNKNGESDRESAINNFSDILGESEDISASTTTAD